MQFHVISMTFKNVGLDQDVLTLLSVAMAAANIKYVVSTALFANIICRNTPATTARYGSLTIA